MVDKLQMAQPWERPGGVFDGVVPRYSVELGCRTVPAINLVPTYDAALCRHLQRCLSWGATERVALHRYSDAVENSA
jgi:hypothetical protein